MKYVRKKNWKENGITLVALVVTIIVLLILAGVTISMALGSNGIIEKAETASNMYANATKDERTAMEETTNEVARLSQRGDEAPGESAGVELKIGGTDLSTVSDLSTLYGQTVSGFSANSTTQAALDTEGITWQLFYDDDDNYYLITSNYVPGSTLPSELLTDGQYTTYCRKFATYSNSTYSGTIMDDEPWSKGTESSTVTGNALTNTYLKWVNSNYVSTKNNPNMKAVAYMMDTSKWSGFAGGVGTAIGGPTIELLSLSWNAVSGHTQMTSYATFSDSNANNNGYKANSPETGSNFFGTATNMWFIKESTNAYGYWLAAPSSDRNYSVRCVRYLGRVSDYYVYDAYYGFRPVVSIPKS